MGQVLAIEISDLEKTYPKGWRRKEKEALKKISLTVSEGEAFGFIGPNGAGKSTTIKILTGLVNANGGSASIFGIPVENPLARCGLGYVPENPYLYDYLSPLEMLAMGLHFHKIKVPNERAYCLGWLDRLGVSDVADKSIRQFSKGMTQRVAIAHALCIKPRLMILDEPLSGLDPLGRRDVVELLSEYKHLGGTLFFTSHVLHDVERLADRFGLIHNGCLHAVQAPAELVGSQEIVQIRTFGECPVDGMREDFPGRWIGEVSRDGLWCRLRELEIAGHGLIEVRPTLSLESAFIRAVEQ